MKNPIGTQVKRIAVKAIQPLKGALDGLAAGLQSLEERRHPQDTLLPGFDRRMQLDGHSCAAQSTAMVLAFFQIPQPMPDILAGLGTDEDGTRLRSVARYLRRQGCTVTSISSSYPKSLRDAIDAGCPVIVSMDGDHAAVVYGYGLDGSDTAFWLADSSLCRALRCRHEAIRFRARWDKSGLVVGAQDRRRQRRRAGMPGA